MHAPPEMLNLLSPDILKIYIDMVIQIILSGYSIGGYRAFRVYTKSWFWVYILTQDIQHFWW